MNFTHYISAKLIKLKKSGIKKVFMRGITVYSKPSTPILHLLTFTYSFFLFFFYNMRFFTNRNKKKFQHAATVTINYFDFFL